MRRILERLIGFDTVSAKSNLELLGYVRGLLADAGIDSVLIPDATGQKAESLCQLSGQQACRG